VNNNYKLVASLICAALFAAVPPAAYVCLLICALSLVTFQSVVLSLLVKLVIVSGWLYALFPFSVKCATRQFMVGFAEAAQFFELRGPTKDADGNAIPAEESK
jgi:hypothetical protein